MVLVYTTFDSHREASDIGKSLVKKKLVACVNIMENKESIYEWQGELITEKEFVLLAKTNNSCVDKAIDYVKQKHSYSTPCILSIPCKATKEYSSWVMDAIKTGDQE